ncbi:MAG: ABC transporter ATP-binding protein [Clostridiales bacterium]|nr:ABC transporter ATP-binding protein [Clostridiales bacterium]
METLINRQLRPFQLNALKSHEMPDDPILFAIIGDISKDARYTRSVFAVSSKSFFTYDLESGECGDRYFFADIENIYTKRMYGNGVIRAKFVSGETKDVYRFTFAVAGLCDAAVLFISAIKYGTKLEEALGAVEAAYEKQLSVCPKCGRTLSAPGVKCINCESRRRIISRLAKYLKPETPILIVSVILSVITTALALIPPYLNRTLVDDILVAGNKADTPIRLFGRYNMLVKDSLLLIGVMLAVNYIIRYGLGAVRGYYLRKSGDRIVKALRNDVYEHAQYLPMRFYDKTSTGSVINRISGDSSTLQSFMLRITQEVVVQFFKMIGIIVVMIIMNWRLAIYSLAPVPFVVVGARIFSKKIAPFYRRIWRRWSSVSSLLTDTIPGIRVIKSFTNEKNATKLFEKKNEEWYETDITAGKILNIYPAVVNCLVSFGSIVIWMLGGLAVIGATNLPGKLTAGLLVSFISYASMFYEPVNFFANLNDSYQHALSSAERIFDILDAEPEHDFGKGNKLPKVRGAIEFRNVSFSYDRTKKVLKRINLKINPGDIVGIVGTTGSGKSTLVNLFLRYYDNYEGKILLDGVDIRKIDLEFFRSCIGYVQQEPMMFHDTIFNNIAYGDARYTVEDVIAAADVANAHEFIIRQPDGYDSVLGERGVGLSGGERQRISIARAILKNPSILVFDEATASVDSETEHLIQEAIEHLISGRTTIMIAHRLSTLSKANKIVVIDNGEIIECGPPEELLAKKGKYYRLVQIQTMSDKVKQEKEMERLE